ncbi:hypothetical protein AVEN_225616-1 [Araneus ventricosus]|uniref:Uncharacterized protein n=1 Tax=Araneus ventricosus TaxID=182803 RepID=A0A4Y2F1W1_ARAVE|nr:hypothetical protein AVEN_225616-1 [Araneus ventricosus]
MGRHSVCPSPRNRDMGRHAAVHHLGTETWVFHSVCPPHGRVICVGMSCQVHVGIRHGSDSVCFHHLGTRDVASAFYLSPLREQRRMDPLRTLLIGIVSLTACCYNNWLCQRRRRMPEFCLFLCRGFLHGEKKYIIRVYLSKGSSNLFLSAIIHRENLVSRVLMADTQ